MVEERTLENPRFVRKAVRVLGVAIAVGLTATFLPDAWSRWIRLPTLFAAVAIADYAVRYLFWVLKGIPVGDNR